MRGKGGRAVDVAIVSSYAGSSNRVDVNQAEAIHAEGSESESENQKETESEADPQGVSHGDALPFCQRRGTRHRLLQDGLQRQGDHALSPAGWTRGACGDQDWGFTHHARR